MPFNEDGSRKTIAYKKSSGFKMTGSPHKTGVIEGTSSHASALKHRTGIFGMFDKFRGRQDEQRAKNQALIAQKKEAERQANMTAPSNAAVEPVQTITQPTPGVPTDPMGPDPNAPLGSEGAVQPDLEELGTD